MNYGPFTEEELEEEVRENPDSRCDCTHPAKYHDPETGACLRTNPVYGPCPCRATSDGMRKALEAVHESHKRYAAAGEISYGPTTATDAVRAAIEATKGEGRTQ